MGGKGSGPAHRYTVGIKEKQCHACKRLLPKSFFWKNSLEPDGYKTSCKECFKKEMNSRYHRKPEASLLTNAKRRAKKRGIAFTITKEDVIIPEFCPVLGIRLVYGRQRGRGPSPDSPSLDRLDNNKGYIKGNVAVISHRANTIKSNATAQELELVLQYARREQKCD